MEAHLIKTQSVAIADIYVPVKRKKMVDPEKVAALAESILENGQKTPIHLRKDGDRLVLVEGLHRLEACRALGEETIAAIFVRAKQW